jgi:hypothetical protein
VPEELRPAFHLQPCTHLLIDAGTRRGASAEAWLLRDPEAVGRILHALFVGRDSSDHEVKIRASDGAGNVQPDEVEWNDLGYLYDGVVGHPVEVL